MVVLARITAPASRTRAAAGASAAAGTSWVAAVPSGTGTPLVAMFSLMVMGTPSSAPLGLALLPARLRRLGFLARALEVGGIERLQPGLPGLDAGDDGVDGLDGREFLALVGGQQVGRGHVVDGHEATYNAPPPDALIRSAMNLVRTGARNRTVIMRNVCMAITKDTSTLVDAAMMAIESEPPGLVAR